MKLKHYISFLFTLLFSIQSPRCQNIKYKIRTIAFYNVENLFDTINNPDTFDEDFTSKGKNHYTSTIYWTKIDKISYVISKIGYEKSNNSPVIIGLAEIENRSVLEDLTSSKNLKDKQYQIIHFDSPDKRGIDVALLYQEKYFNPISQENFEVKLWDDSGKRVYTRDILLVNGLLEDELIHIIVNHWPSRRGGQLKSNPRRAKAAFITHKIIEKIVKDEVNAKIFVMGDFNDDPVSKSIKEGLHTTNKKNSFSADHSLYNPMENMYKQGLNTLGYRDGLNLFDQIMLSKACLSLDKNYASYKYYLAGIFNPNYIITQKGRYKGYPFRSFQNNNYTGGYSDHFPVYIYLIKKE